MTSTTTNVEQYFTDGCGRCALGGTPKCKVHRWSKELMELRLILLGCGLQEESKWGVPCYTYQKKNIAILAAFKDYCGLSFFKGSLMSDTAGILLKAGENTQSARTIHFTSVGEVINKKALLNSYIFEGIEVENAGLKVEFKKNPEPIPEEFQKYLKKNTALKTAFEALTPGRQRGYILHFAQAKQSKTRTSRIEKCIPKIMKGKGFQE